MPKSNYLEQNIIQWLRGNAMPSAPTSVYVALSTANPGEAGAGLAEPDTADGYARQAVTFPAGSQGVDAFTTSNNNLVSFGPATDDWGTLTHFALFDAVTAGNMLYHGALDVSRAAPAGTTIQIGIGDLTVGEA